ncbi:MAG: glycosyltransferase family 4 protein [Bryobacteraceae bacterium]
MTILSVFNYYKNRGGEEEVYKSESALLESKGHTVVHYTKHNNETDNMNLVELGVSALWNQRSYQEIRSLIRQTRPRVVHCHNTFPLISPAAYHAAQSEGVPVVQTLHNFRLLCPAAIFYRDGKLCEDCLGKRIPWPGIAHGCYQSNRAASATVAGMLAFHHGLSTWADKVDAYIALTDFQRDKFIAGGLPSDRVLLKPNFADPDPGMGSGNGRYALFVGYLAPQKGVETILSAWERSRTSIPLKIAGDGPLLARVSEVAQRVPSIEVMGRQSRDAISQLMQEAAVLLFPSTWYEAMPRTIAESFAAGLPVIASRLGSMISMVRDKETGLHFEPGNAEDLMRKVEWALSNPGVLTQMRTMARQEYEQKYTAETNYSMLMNIYEQVVSHQ